MHFGHAGGCRFEYKQCFLSFRLAEETFLASPAARRCPTEGTLGHLQPRPACPRRLRSVADTLAFISPSLAEAGSCEHIAAGGPGGQGGQALPSFRCETQLVPATRSHQPNGAINQVGGISLICYRGEQPEKASAHCRPRKSGHGAASCGRRASARRPLCCSNVSFIFIHHPCACQVHTDQKFAREICGFPHGGTNISGRLVLQNQANLA